MTQSFSSVSPTPALDHWSITALLRGEQPTVRATVATLRLLGLAGAAPGGVVSVTMGSSRSGRVWIDVSATSQTGIGRADFEWVLEDTATLEPAESGCEDTVPDHLVEVIPALSGPAWPRAVADCGMEILRALSCAPAQIRMVLGPASDLDRQMLDDRIGATRPGPSADPLQTTGRDGDSIGMAEYVGVPVNIRCLIGADRPISPRLRAGMTGLAVGTRLVDADPGSVDVRRAWQGQEAGLAGATWPAGTAACLVRLPACGPVPVVCGVPTLSAPIPPVPLQDSTCRHGLRLGQATTSQGRRRDVLIDPSDLLLHTQVIGATGTGKSTLLAQLVSSAISQGLGLTVLDPHGTLVTRVLEELPAHMATHTLVVRSGDLDHPVPVNPLNTPDHEAVQATMIGVLRDLMDPRGHGFMGPVFERLMSLLLDVQRALIGGRATLAAIPATLGTKAELSLLIECLATADPALASRVRTELYNLNDSSYGETTTWAVSKFQRLTATPQMRAITGTGDDTIDVATVMDRHKVLLVDLASPSLGTPPSQFLGEMWLAKHWSALSRRAHPDRPHLLIVDEAHLYGSGLLARILAEGRKFGLAAVIAHQNLDQLPESLQAATQSTTSNLIALRTGIRETLSVTARLGTWPGGPLTRLPRLDAAVTLSDGPTQTDPFTLHIDYNQRNHRGDPAIATTACQQTWHRYAESRTPVITHKYLMGRARRPASPVAGRPGKPAAPAGASDYIDQWLAASDPTASTRQHAD